MKGCSGSRWWRFRRGTLWQWLVGVAVAEDAGTVAQVDVFQVGEMEFVEEAGFLEVFFAVEGGSGAGRKNGHGGVVVGGGAAFSYGKCPA